MYFKRSAKVADCAGGTSCSSQPYPPPNGHWGTPYKLCKNAACTAAGGAINHNDYVFFEQLQSQVWAKTGPGFSAGQTTGALLRGVVQHPANTVCTDSTTTGCFRIKLPVVVSKPIMSNMFMKLQFNGKYVGDASGFKLVRPPYPPSLVYFLCTDCLLLV